MPLYTFVDNAVPTSAQWNANLRDQVVTQCTSGTRPSSPVEGQHIFETDTDRLLVWNGAGWVIVYALGGSYTPSLVGMAVGTGGSATNTATWGYAGGSLFVSGTIIFGTSGTTFPGATITASLPSGFTASPNPATVHAVGTCVMNDAGTDAFQGVCRLNSSTTVRFVVIGASGTYANGVATSTTVPFTWVAGDGIYWTATVLGSF